MDKIVIFVDEIIKDGCNGVTLNCDFKSQSDYFLFAEELKLDPDGSTGFCIRNVKPGGVRSETYHTLNVDVVKEKFDCNKVEDSWLFGFELTPHNGEVIPFNEIVEK